MAETVGRMATITDMESKLPKQNEQVQHLRDLSWHGAPQILCVPLGSPSPQASLWECEEQVLRHMLEDGKLNLCLRNLVRRPWLGGQYAKELHLSSPDRPRCWVRSSIRFTRGRHASRRGTRRTRPCWRSLRRQHPEPFRLFECTKPEPLLAAGRPFCRAWARCSAVPGSMSRSSRRPTSLRCSTTLVMCLTTRSRVPNMFKLWLELAICTSDKR